MRCLLSILALLTLQVSAQNISSPYLTNPELMIGYADSCARFWIPSYDTTYGGFFTNVGRDGSVLSSWGTNKNMLTQSRHAYGFTRAFMLTGDTLFLSYARKALDFQYQFARDTAHGGWFSEIGMQGNVINPTNMKSAFDQHYALLGPAAYFEATRDSQHLNVLLDGYQSLENHLWDSRPDYQGYYDLAAYDWSSTGGKSFNATVDAFTTHLLSLYLLTGNTIYKERIEAVCANIIDYFVASMPDQAIGFAEKYTANWDVNNGEAVTIMGHVLKSAWCLGRYFHYVPDAGYQTAAEQLIYDVYNNGYDHEYGGPYKDYNRITGEMMMWGILDTAKAWWQMEQAVTAGLVWYYHTRNSDFLTMADESLDFFMTHFVDHQYGEVYENRTRYGNEVWGLHKGTGFKAAYHSIELAFYTYLYGNLLLHNAPATLYYLFEEQGADYTVSINPFAVNDSLLAITNVTLNGQPYTNYSGQSRELTVTAGSGGIYAVTFEHSSINSIENNPIEPAAFELRQNYPNPFNPVTTIEFTIPERSVVKLTIYNQLGEIVTELLNKELQPGSHQYQFNAGSLASGVYLYSIEAGGFNQTKKMLLLK